MIATETQKPSPSTSASGSVARRAVAFDLKGTMAPLTVLRLRTLDLTLIERQLRIKIAQLPQLFLDAPVMLDLGALERGGAGLPFGDLVRMLRSCKLVPVAVANIADAERDRAAAVGLGVLQPAPAQARPRADGRGADTSLSTAPTPGPESVAAQARPAPAPAPAPHSGPMVIRQPVRSGQVIYAQNADLVVLAPVNPGAQIIADGHIHVYAPLRGRAIAGVQGLLGARIFCQRLEAELVAISGAYLTADDIPADVRGRPAQVYFDEGECRISLL
ncbi:MAG TPA: septum site-determining protein MinC [Polyangia bacterium]|nr:septum site-determining protein MinC [Polyangia bacterium]